MPVYSGRGLTQAADNCFIHLVGGVPRYLVGVIHRQDTGDRDNPPACQCGFDAAGTPFARGHIMALELGGCDVSQNIVPQYGLWQGNGDWRQMETALRAGVQEVMIVEIDYQVAAANYAPQKLRFAGGEKLFHWADPGIPNRFRVWAVADDWVRGAVSLADYLAADNAGKEGQIAALIGALHAVGTTFDQAIAAMPAIDRTYWMGQMVRSVTPQLYDDYRAAASAARAAAVAALVAPAAGAGGGGMMRRVSVRQAVVKAAASPYARPQPLPPEPDSYATWIGKAASRDEVIAAIRANTANASVGWTAAERLALTRGDVAQMVG